MDTNLIKPYEISIWGMDESGEYKIAVIGSDQMSALSRPCSPHFMRKSNGEKQLDFVMYTRYWDSDVGDFVDNPFIKLMCNERVVKLKYEDKWHDFIIKQIVESSDKKSYTYTAKDRFVQELGKTGFEIELDTELENNQGTNIELADKVLAGTDWIIDTDNSDIIEELLVEPLFVGVLGSNIKVKNLRNENENEKEIKAGQTVYLYYKQLVAKETETLSIIYDAAGYVVDQDRVIIENKNNEPIGQFYVLGINEDNNIVPFEYEKDETGVETIIPNFINGDGLTYSTEYRGERLVRSQKSKYDANLGRYVDFYKNNNNEYACFTETDYIMPETLVNLVTNGSDFKNTSGWLWGTGQTVEQVFVDNNGNIYGPDSTEFKDTSWQNLANIRLEKDDAGTLKPGLKINSNSGWIVNTGLKDSRNIIKSIAPGDNYILKIEGKSREESQSGVSIVGLNIGLAEYEYDSENNRYVPVLKEENGEEAYNFLKFYHESLQSDGSVELEEKDYITFPLLTKESSIEGCFSFSDQLSAEDLSKKKWGFVFQNTSSEEDVNRDIYITNIQFFKKVNKINTDGSIDSEKYYYPGETENFSAIVKQYYNLYEYPAKVIPEEFTPLLRLESLDGYIPVYNNNFAKVRSISARESNRFNLLQEICEKFECWMELRADYYDTGKIDPGSKRVVFKRYVGQKNDAGFRYGINLKSIQRTLDSNQITTKLIVKSNTNEFGKNGFCTIARATENPTGENFLLDFDYYTRHNLLNEFSLRKDLYGLTSEPDIEIDEDKDEDGNFKAPDELCYYQRLKVLNENAQKKTEDLALVTRELDEIDAEKQVTEAIISNAEELIADLIKSFNSSYKDFNTYINYLGGKISKDELPNDLKDLFEEAKKDSAIATVCQQIIVYEQQIRENEGKLSTLEIRWKEAEEKYNKLLDDLNTISKKKVFLNGLFFQKYSSFIQEGIWSSEDYYDDNLYYLDAENTLYNSAFPKVTYSINVVEVSALTGYEGYSMDVGDRTYIEDIEFFGYGADGRPYQEQIVVNQLDKYLDEPTKDKISVKNYKNQFEDLFQRITAQTQSLQYHEGEYARSAATVLPGGSIDEGALSDTLANNNLLLSIGKNKSLTWDSDGFTNIDPKVRSEMVQITGGAIRLTSDGGNTWGTAITGAGINAKYIKTGQLDTSLIRIMTGDNAAFRWDKNGITAFNINSNVPNPHHFIRMDQYGLYGIENSSLKSSVDDPWLPDNIQEIETNASFALIQSGLFMNWIGAGLSINNNGIIFKQNGTNRVQMGPFGDDNKSYGFLLKDAVGNTIFKTIDTGLELANGATITSEDIKLELIKPDIEFEEKGLKISKGVTSIYAETLGGIVSQIKEYNYITTNGSKAWGTYDITGNIQNQFILYNKNSYDNENLPGFAVSSIFKFNGKYIKSDDPDDEDKNNSFKNFDSHYNKIGIYGSTIGNVNSDGTISFNSSEDGYNRGYLMMSYFADKVDKTTEAGFADSTSNAITSFIKINSQGILFRYQNTYLRLRNEAFEYCVAEKLSNTTKWKTFQLIET